LVERDWLVFLGPAKRFAREMLALRDSPKASREA
jgi:hypothetical protein